MVEFLMAFLDGELPDGQREAFEEHLRLCPPCEVYLETYKEAVELGRAVCQDEEGPPDAPEELVQAILDARRR
jgi:anti-sigma factor RsiW